MADTQGAAEPPEAEPIARAEVNPDPVLELGEPFAISHDCALLDRDAEAGIPGCRATVQCDCGQMFAINLLADGEKVCPGCDLEYGHVLLVAPADDPEIIAEALALVLEAAGISPADVAEALGREPNPDDSDDSDDSDDPIPEAT